MNAVAIPQATGDWHLKQRDADQMFAQTELSDNCVDAANRAARQFDAGYPGWQLYSRIVRGDTLFNRQLAAWAIGSARYYARAKKINGQAVVAPRGRRNDWIAQAGIDALYFVIHGHYAESANVTADRLGVWHTKYKRIRGELAAFMLDGFANYQSELHYQYSRVMRDVRRVA